MQSGQGQGINTIYPATGGVQVISTSSTTATRGPQQQQAQPAYPQQQHTQPQYGQQHPQQQVVVLQAAPAMYRPMRTGPTIYKSYPGVASQILGAVQIALGALLILFNIIGIVIKAEHARSGTGMWTGVFFIITGAFGIPAGRTKLQCHIVSFMVMSIISAVLAVPVLITYSVGAACDSKEDCYNDYWDYKSESQKGARVGMGTMMALFGATELIVAIVSSGLCCGGMCCYGPSSQGEVVGQGTVHYVTTQNAAQPAYPNTHANPQAYVTTTNYQPQPAASQPPAPPSYSGDAPPPYNVDAPPSDQKLYKY